MHKIFDTIIIGGGHAGCEAAAASARIGADTLLITHNLDMIGEMSCNPAIGGVGKGHLVREIDALDGIMGKAADAGGIQFRILNRSKGPAVYGPRTQADRVLYKQAVQSLMKAQENLTMMAGAVEDLIIADEKVMGVILADGTQIHAVSVVLTTGTFLSGVIHIGTKKIPAGRIGEQACYGLSEVFRKFEFPLGRLKTGTPPRLRSSTIAWEKLEMQKPDEHPAPFSFMNDTITNRQIECGITYTNVVTHKIIRDNIEASAIYSGQITSPGPRYCPSIEDKVIRFAERERHQIFLEPEGLDSDIIYPNGISTALPEEIQDAYIHSIVGLENCKITQYGYAIEYDYIDPKNLYPNLETKKIKNLFLAGQINGTTGYEEAAGQGVIAGINAAHKATGGKVFTLDRTNSYIGVMIDDLTQHGVQEPYRMFTSRAEYRLWLRSDNADERLFQFAIDACVMGSDRAQKWQKYYTELEEYRHILDNIILNPHQIQTANIRTTQDGKKRTALGWLSLPQISWQELANIINQTAPNHRLADIPKKIQTQLEIDALYSSYIKRQKGDMVVYQRDKNLILPDDLDYTAIAGLSMELQQKLTQVKPRSLAEAAKIAGMTPAALVLLLRLVKKFKKQKIYAT